MNSPKKILYIQHASSLGGSCTSLLYTMRALDKTKYQPILALANDSQIVIDFYKAAGFDPIPWPGITFWNHTTAGYQPLYKVSGWMNTLKIMGSWQAGKRRTLDLVKLVQPDLVHLNSVVLSASAAALAQAKVPFVWHIREHPPKEFLGIRTAIIRHLMLHCPNELVFISEADRQAWVSDQRGQVIYNFVDFQQFNRLFNGADIRKKNKIPLDAPVALYLGGLRELKGIFPLLKALSILKKRLPRLRCLMPGSEYKPPNHWSLNLARRILPLIGSGTAGQRVEKEIARLNLKEICIRLPFQVNIVPLIASSDMVVFPALRPHFARPVIEANAMAKPVVASRLEGIEELIQSGKTGLMVEPNNPESLAKGLFDVLSDPVKAKQMGEAGYEFAKEKFSADKNCRQIMEIYERILKNIQ